MEENNKLPVALLKKLAAIMAEADYIQKDKRNEFHKYRYASEQAIKEKLHPLLVKHGVLFFPISILQQRTAPTKEGGEWLSDVAIEFAFIDSETGEELRGVGAGTGTDKGDKSVYKAITGAIKYILTTTFLIPTGDDPEDDANEKPTRQQAKAATPEPTVKQHPTPEQRTRLDNWLDANRIGGQERIALCADAAQLSPAQFETWLQDQSDKREAAQSGNGQLPPSDTPQTAPDSASLGHVKRLVGVVKNLGKQLIQQHGDDWTPARIKSTIEELTRGKADSTAKLEALPLETVEPVAVWFENEMARLKQTTLTQ
ncbi:ERF family protein [Candidatus Pacearchaeota archaeon]|jgi:hypothetical protein|nr:ERF family protein [Candidatus Pacearchaeota archaeon]